MNELVIPETIASQLQGLPHPVRICAPTGKLIGCFLPVVDPSLYEIEGADLTAAELQEIENSTEWYSTSEILRHLEKLK
jgi:hypothetical protein